MIESSVETTSCNDCATLKELNAEFIAPSIELIPAKCKLKIARSTEPPE